MAEKHGLTPTQLALAWCKSRWNVTSTIIGATTMDQLKVRPAWCLLPLAMLCLLLVRVAAVYEFPCKRESVLLFALCTRMPSALWVLCRRILRHLRSLCLRRPLRTLIRCTRDIATQLPSRLMTEELVGSASP